MVVKKKIIILGEHSEIKENLCKTLAEYYHLKYHSIHQMRKGKPPDASSREYEIKDKFIRRISKSNQPALINISGTGVTAFLLDNALRQKKNLEILLLFDSSDQLLTAYPYFRYLKTQIKIYDDKTQLIFFLQKFLFS